VVLVVGFVFFMMKGSDAPAEGPAGEPNVPTPGLESPAPQPGVPPPPPPPLTPTPPPPAVTPPGPPAPTPSDLHVPAPCSTPGQMAIAVRIVTTTAYSDDIRWDIDGGAQFPGAGAPYEDNQVYYKDMCLPAGSHTIHYIDAYRDGWGEGAYWSLLDSSGSLIAGGPEDGVVSDAGGETDFTLVEGGAASSSVEAPVTVTIFADGEFTSEISWQIDDGDSLPPEGVR
jgi:hypothetical protein